MRRAFSYADQQPHWQYEPEDPFSYRLLDCRDRGISIRQYFYVSAQKVASIPYSQFEQLLHEHKVSEVGVSDRYLQGKLKEPLPNGKSEFVTTRVDPQFADELQKYGVTYTGEVGSTLLQDLLSWTQPPSSSL